MSDKKRLPPVPSEPVAIKDWFEGKGTSQSVKLTPKDIDMFLRLEQLYPGEKVCNFRDLVRLLGKAAFEGGVNMPPQTSPAELLADNPYRTGNLTTDTYIEGLILRIEILEEMGGKDNATKKQLETRNKELEIKLQNRERALKAIQETYAAAFSVRFHQLKERTEQWIAHETRHDAANGPFTLSNEEFIAIVLGYAERDPSEGFPFDEDYKPILQNRSHAGTGQPTAAESGNTDTTATRELTEDNYT